MKPTLGGELAVSTVEGITGLTVQSQPLVLVNGTEVEVSKAGTNAGHLEGADLVILRDLDSLVSSDTVSAQELLAVFTPGAGQGVLITAVAIVLILLLPVIIIPWICHSKHVVHHFIFTGGCFANGA